MICKTTTSYLILKTVGNVNRKKGYPICNIMPKRLRSKACTCIRGFGVYYKLSKIKSNMHISDI